MTGLTAFSRETSMWLVGKGKSPKIYLQQLCVHFHHVWRLFKTCWGPRGSRVLFNVMIFKLKGIPTANSADTVKVFGGEVNILAQIKASDWPSVQPKADESPNRTSCDLFQIHRWQDDRQERTGCVHVNRCVSCVCVICVCMCVEKVCFSYFTRGGSSCSLWFFLCSFDLQREDSGDMRWDSFKSNQLKLEETWLCTDWEGAAVTTPTAWFMWKVKQSGAWESKLSTAVDTRRLKRSYAHNKS